MSDGRINKWEDDSDDLSLNEGFFEVLKVTLETGRESIKL